MTAMSIAINPIDHPICLAAPELLAQSHWAEHVPFAMWIISVLRPRLFVELGTFRGTSYCGFCQSIKRLGLPTRTFAVDTWKGDPHNGVNGPEILEELRGHHDPRYGTFSSLLEMSFDEAAQRFENGEIDLLHIDGYHTYEAVRHDYETWRPKLSDRGVILFHDVVEHMRDFGVWRFWDETRTQYPSFEFHHQHGLGVLAIGHDLPREIKELTSIDAEGAAHIRTFFHELGRRVSLAMERDVLAGERDVFLRQRDAVLEQRDAVLEQRDALLGERDALLGERDALLSERDALLAEVSEHHRQASLPCSRQDCWNQKDQLLGHASELKESLHAMEDRLRVVGQDLADARLNQSVLERSNEALQRTILCFKQERSALEQSASWRATRRVARLASSIAPPGSGRRRTMKRIERLLEITHREGIKVIPRRLWSKAKCGLTDMARLGFGQQTPWVPDGRPVFVLVHRRGGGGTDRHLRELTTGLRTAGVRPVMISPGPRNMLTWEEPGTAGQRSWTFQGASTRESMTALLEALMPVHAHIHNMMKLPEMLLELLVLRGVTYDWTLHDYYPICPRAHLDRGDGRYCGEPEPAACDFCLARLGDYRGQVVNEPIEAWRERYAAYLRGARRIFAPTNDARLRLERYVPGVSMVVRAHLEVMRAPGQVAAPYQPDKRVRVAVLGTITAFKGSVLLQTCAEDAARNQRPLEFVVLGRTDRNAALARTGRVKVTGPYSEDKVFERLSTAQCHLAFLPSVVPETYMYTLSIVMAAGLFPVCLDLGAQAERIRAWGCGLVLPLDASPAEINQALIETATSLAERRVPPPPERPPASIDLLDFYYGFTDEERRRFGLPPGRMPQATPQPHLERRNAHARLH